MLWNLVSLEYRECLCRTTPSTMADLTLNLILDEDLSAYREMQTWLEECVYKKGETVNHDVTVIILNYNNSCGKIRYKNAIPTQLGAVELTSTIGDVAYISFDVTFRFTEFEFI